MPSEKDGIDFMESVTQNQTLKHQSDLEMKGEEVFPPRGDFFQSPESTCVSAKESTGGLEMTAEQTERGVS